MEDIPAPVFEPMANPGIVKKSPSIWKVVAAIAVGIMVMLGVAFGVGVKTATDMRKQAMAAITPAPTAIPMASSVPELDSYPMGNIYYLDFDKSATRAGKLKRDLYVLDEIGKTVTQLTDTHDLDDLDVGIDERTLTVVRAGEVWTANLLGKWQKQITHTDGKVNQVKVSPDKKQIAYNEFVSGQINTPDSIHTTMIIPVGGGTAKNIWPPKNTSKMGADTMIDGRIISSGTSLTRWVNSNLVEVMGCEPYMCGFSWWVNTASESAEFAGNDDISQVAANMTPDQKYISVTGDGNLTIFGADLKVVYQTPFSKDGRVAMTADRKYLLAYAQGGVLKVVDVLKKQDANLVLPEATADTKPLLFERAPNGNIYYFVGNSLKRFSLGTGKEETVIDNFGGNQWAFLDTPVWIVN